MASILNSKVNYDHVVLSLKLSLDEFKELGGSFDNLHLISESEVWDKSTVLERGKNGHTKYLLLPSQFHKGINLSKELTCMKFERKEKIIIVYIIDKLNFTDASQNIINKSPFKYWNL